MKWKDAALGYVIGRTAEAGIKTIYERLKASDNEGWPKDDDIPAMQMLNRGRQLLGEGKTSEAIEVIRAANQLGQNAGDGNYVLDCFVLGIVTAFNADGGGSEPIWYSGLRKHIDDRVLAFIAEISSVESAAWIRQLRNDYLKKHSAASA